jgi:gustatory receptor
MLYSVIFYVTVGAYVIYTGMVKLQEMKALKSSEFDETVNGYLFLMYLVPHFAVPLCNWIQADQVACFLNDWTAFQVVIFQLIKCCYAVGKYLLILPRLG